ncbi:alpha/beta hydrolase [Clostridium sp. FP1]|uniref:alpha/beta hydrolase n=1 Tax=Clostridium sp. FP1 TaxID=2724076 RepID=UPI0013E99722|nr:alpha/beta hydrolase [Clostridium sp. FP1]MBZ9635137.1 alpha/beta hydrolase [Clostridium sp. FP1]
MKGLFLCGYGCKPWIWENIEKSFRDDENNIKFIEWPTNSTNYFNNISDFSTWVKDNFIIEDEYYDFIVGHSMGGLIALHLSTLKSLNLKHIVLIESYITSPGKFFQNLLMEDTNGTIKENVTNMLNQESKYYSPILRNQLQNLDLTWMINKANSNIHFIYGDRGINNKEIVISKLGINPIIQKHIDIEIVSNSCHFPMIESSENLLSVLKNIIK